MKFNNEHYLSCVVRKPAFCICENKGADQLRGNREADQRLCFLYMDSAILLLFKSEISSPQPSSVVVQPGLYRTWSEIPKTGFLTTRLISYHNNTDLAIIINIFSCYMYLHEIRTMHALFGSKQIKMQMRL